MQARSAHFLLTAALLLSGVPARAKDTAKAANNRPTLAIVVVDNLDSLQVGFGEFDRIDLAFRHVAKQRKWPVAVMAERLAANTPVHPLELRIFYQGLREDIGNEFTFRGWMILTVNGVKHDLGIVSFRQTIRPWQNNDDLFEKTFQGAARVAADKIEPLIFTRVPAQAVSSSDAVPGKR